MFSVTYEKIIFPLLTILLVISLGFVNKAEASAIDGKASAIDEKANAIVEPTNDLEDVRYTTEVLDPENEMSILGLNRWYVFEGTFFNTLYTAKTMTVDSDNTFYFQANISATNKAGYVEITVQRKNIVGSWVNVAGPYRYNPTSYVDRSFPNLSAGEYRLKFVRTAGGNSTTVKGQMGTY